MQPSPCAGTTTRIRAATALNTLLTGTSTPTAGSLAPGGAVNLRIGLSIPSTPVVTADGASTYQGTTATITWTFAQQQASGAVANS